MTQDDALLDLLACPKCHGTLRRASAPAGLGCERCRVLYAIDDGLPNMLVEDAKPWSHDGATSRGGAPSGSA